jgi:hypothetical protein
MYPIAIQDNFFPDPNLVVDFAMKQEYFPDPNGYWPGKRTKQLHELDKELFAFIGNKIHNIFYESTPRFWEMELSFQLISPLHKNSSHLFNHGWVHKDTNSFFGGVIYLNKNPEDKTGTSIFKPKKGYSQDVSDYLKAKEKFYKNEDISEEEYNNAFISYHSQYEETVSVKNVYNRMLLFGGDIHHAAQSFGSSGERLTISFFSKGMVGAYPPLVR